MACAPAFCLRTIRGRRDSSGQSRNLIKPCPNFHREIGGLKLVIASHRVIIEPVARRNRGETARTLSHCGSPRADKIPRVKRAAAAYFPNVSQRADSALTETRQTDNHSGLIIAHPSNR